MSDGLVNKGPSPSVAAATSTSPKIGRGEAVDERAMAGRLLFVFFYLVFASPFASAKAPSFTVLLSSTAVLPGDTLRVELDGVSPNKTSRALFQGGSYPFYPIGPDAQRALIGIRLGALPGRYPLRIDFRKGQPSRWAAFGRESVEISTRVYPAETVRFSPEKTALLKWENREAARIHKLLLYLSRSQSWEGAFDFPVKGEIEGQFGARRIRNGRINAGFHKGYDLKAPLETPILASNSGIVMMAARLKAHGRVVLLNHGQGVMTIYLHMNSLAVKPGEKVVKSQRLGTVGSSGLSASPHVHWGLYVHSVPVDPKPWTESEF